MPFDPFALVPIGRTGLVTTRLGLGGGSIGGLFGPVTDAAATALIEHAWAMGIRSYDVAPLYGYGSSERRMGSVLSSRPREDFVLSTKVGRLVRASSDVSENDDIDRQAVGEREDAFFAGTAGRRMVFDYSFQGVMRSVEESLTRLGLSRIDTLYIHDPDDHWDAAIEGAYPALARLRAERVIAAIGVGMNQSAMLARFADAGDFDVFMLAGRYTLLDQEALSVLLPRCIERGIAVMVAGVMNSGILADPKPGSRYDYGVAPADVVARGRHLAAICARHDVPLRAAAIQFPLAHPAITGLIAGVRTATHLDEYPESMRRTIPTSLWDDMRRDGLIPDAAPTPA